MSKWAKIGIIGAAVVLLGILLYYFGFANGEEDEFVTDDWGMSYDPDLKDPYGTYMLKNLLDTTGLFGNFLELDAPLEETLEDNEEINDIYFFVGRENYLRDTSAEFLIDFVSEGNTVVMSAERFPEEMMSYFTYGTSQKEVFETIVVDSSQFLKYSHPTFRGKRYAFDFIFKNQKTRRDWHYFDLENFDEYMIDTLHQLGSNTSDQINFVKFPFGNGYFFLHSQPYLFTNISLMRRDGFQYAENFFRHIPPGRVQWDKYNLQYNSSSSNSSNSNGKSGGGGEKKESVLQFITNNPPLFWAFLVLLFGGILYAIFKGKRMQTIVPATESKDNMSLQYINTLSSLYLKERKHIKLVRLKEKTFLNFIAEHYYIQSSNPDEKFIQKVAVKSNVSVEKIQEIFNLFEMLQKRHTVTDQELIHLHKRIEHFYKICR